MRGAANEEGQHILLDAQSAVLALVVRQSNTNLTYRTLALQVPLRRGGGASDTPTGPRERELFIDHLLVRIRLIIEIILVDRPCAMGV